MTNRPAPTLPTPAERRRLREAASLSQAALAARMSVTSTTIHSWETGRATPRGRALEAYASFLTTTADRPGPAGKPVRTSRSQAGTAVKGPRTRPGARWARRPRPRRSPPARRRPARAPPGRNRRVRPRAPAPDRGDPREAFDALYASCAGVLVRQTYLLTGRHTVAVESVERAFQLAWERWPEVAVDRDPAGWVRAAAHEYALSPWHRMRAAHRRPATPGAVLPPPRGRADHDLMDALLSLAPATAARCCSTTAWAWTCPRRRPRPRRPPAPPPTGCSRRGPPSPSGSRPSPTRPPCTGGSTPFPRWNRPRRSRGRSSVRG